ncbi:TonB-dependent receptor plug domain-containing protein [Muriicola sp. Z0-33]|uniref:TonB-dependent receptor plug domain-containing protein n=1 Tax=Muriicola sp. Z0-33 TaxID=2816957 RepID=UPI00223722DF|nr:TonB-dependent receptor [Muriicola sp. Z0-33]MCW5517082.1 TonB-dependent receptor [Muriicola sp. Z0-33]
MTKKFISNGIAAWCCFALAAQQQQDTTRLQILDEVVVSDSRFELKRENSGKTVIKIGVEELQRNQGRSVAEIINTKSGIEIAGSRGRDGAVLGVFARGGRGRQVLIIVDGVRVSDPSSFSLEYDLRLLATANVASIEIIKGAASTLYGTNAATAVINITTKGAAKEKMRGEFQSVFGTNQTAVDQNYNLSNFSNSARVSGTLNKFSYSTSFSNRYSEGLSAIVTPENEEDNFSNSSNDIRLGYQFSEKFNLVVYGNQTRLRSAFDESFGLMDAPYQFISDQDRIGASLRLKFANGGIYFNGAYTNYESESKSAFPGVFKARNYVGDLYGKYTFNDKLYTILGVNYLEDTAEFISDEKFTILDPYANLVFVSDFGLNINSGIRINNHSEYGSNLVYNINPSYTFKFNDRYIKLLSSFASSYITPSLTQLFGTFGANPNLDPEDNSTLEGGVEYAGNQFRVSGIYFNRKEENFVFFDGASSTYLNAANTIDAQGVELEMNWKPVNNLNLHFNYTFTERKGDSAIRIPKHKFNFLGSYSFSERTSGTISYTMTGERSDTDFNVFPFEEVPLDAFSVVNIYLQHQIIPNKLRCFLNLDNILNKEFTEVIGFTTRGRNIALGMNISL